ncbi:response regulator transcription factor [soil metagenome]
MKTWIVQWIANPPCPFEAEIGAALGESGVPQEDIFPTTKLPPDRAGMTGGGSTRPAAASQRVHRDAGHTEDVIGSENGSGDPVRVLVVDDEPALTDVVATVLRYEGWAVRTAATGSQALTEFRSFSPDLVVLDVMLPDLDGFEVLQRLRSNGVQTPVLFLTARDATEDRVRGLTLGGDDYVVKPFSLEELVARLRALLRRAGIAHGQRDSVLQVADLVLDEEAREVRRGGELVQLTATEFELLRYLMRNARRVVSKAQILDRVWHYDFGGQANIVELYVGYLRRKLDRDREPLIHTVRGVGYVLRAPEAAR